MRGKKYTGNLAFSFNNYRYIFAVPGLPNVLTRDWIILHRYYTFRVRWPPDPNEMPKTWNLSYVYLNITYISKREYFEAKKKLESIKYFESVPKRPQPWMALFINLTCFFLIVSWLYFAKLESPNSSAILSSDFYQVFEWRLYIGLDGSR